MVQKKHKKKASFIEATMITTVSLIITRVISVAYMIPFTSMIQDDAMTINNYATPIFSQFYELSLAGMPLAIARLIAMYNAKSAYKTSNRILKYAQIFMLMSGIILGFCFFLFANVLANFTLVAEQKQLFDNLVRMMQIIAPALVILPFMSGMRGYLQGFRSVIGPALSQVVERFIFVFFMLASLFIGLYYLNIPDVEMIGYASIAQPIASISAVFVLIPFYRSVRKEHKKLMKQDEGRTTYKTTFLVKQIILTSLPFFIAGFASTSYMLITTLTYTNIRELAGVAISLVEVEYNVISYYTNKLVSIPLTFSLAMSTAIISFVTLAFESNNMISVRNYVQKSYQMIIFTTLGTILLMAMLGKPLLTFFYGYHEMSHFYAERALLFDGFRGVFFAVETISISLLQALGKKNKAVLYTLLGPLVKLCLTLPFVYYFGIYGEIFSVIIGLALVIVLSTKMVLQLADVTAEIIFTAFFKTLLCLVPSMVFLFLVNVATNHFAPELLEQRLTAFTYLGGIGSLALALFLMTAELTGFLKTIFGQDFNLRNNMTQLYVKITKQ